MWAKMKREAKVKGLYLHPPWVEFEAFRQDIGPWSEGLILRRIDPECGFTPGNCRWEIRKKKKTL